MKRFAINSPHIVHEVFSDEEAAIINLTTGNYYSLNPTGAAIWALIEKNLASADIIETCLNLYELDSINIESEIKVFFGKLQNEGLIIECENSAESPSVSVSESAKNAGKTIFVKPNIERFADFQELLLLDPIHDVDEAGFPHKKAE